MPTSGFIAVLMMLHACDAVSLFGANFVEGVDSYHYWEDSKAWPEVCAGFGSAKVGWLDITIGRA
jgi:hypothetical protein